MNEEKLRKEFRAQFPGAVSVDSATYEGFKIGVALAIERAVETAEAAHPDDSRYEIAESIRDYFG